MSPDAKPQVIDPAAQWRSVLKDAEERVKAYDQEISEKESGLKILKDLRKAAFKYAESVREAIESLTKNP